MEKFKFLPHTADVKFQAFGKDLEECFVNAGYALTDVITKDKIKPKQKKKIKIEGRDRERLLYDFLEELLFLLDVGNFLVSEIKNLKITGVAGKKKYREIVLEAELYGDDAKEYETKAHVKAVTYNDMFIKQEDGRFVCQVVLDL
jgi:SHS2 domain-containing protein